MKTTIIMKSSNNHYTEGSIEIKDRALTAPAPFYIKHAEHDSLHIREGKRCIRKVVEKDPFEDKIREVQD